jgi:hypothetical protein
MKTHEYVWLLITLAASGIASYRLITDFAIPTTVLGWAYLVAGIILAVNVAAYIGYKLFQANNVKG